MLLIRKASEKVKDESEIHEEEVRMSIDEQISFNMNPFLWKFMFIRLIVWVFSL